MGALTLGDAGTENTDESYEGQTGALSIDWFRQKFTEFQLAMTAADEAYQAGLAAFVLTGDESIANLLAEYDSKASEIKTIAETLNSGAEIANAIGVRMPVLSIPQSLGALPALVFPAVVVAAAAAVAGWYAWARGFASGVEHAIDAARQAGATPEVLQALTSEHEKATAAVGRLDLSPLISAGTWVKLLVVGGLAFLAWRSFNDVIDR